MNVERRNELIDACFGALDEEEFSLVEPYLAPELTCGSVGIDTLYGPDVLRRYFEEL